MRYCSSANKVFKCGRCQASVNGVAMDCFPWDTLCIPCLTLRTVGRIPSWEIEAAALITDCLDNAMAGKKAMGKRYYLLSTGRNEPAPRKDLYGPSRSSGIPSKQSRTP